MKEHVTCELEASIKGWPTLYTVPAHRDPLDPRNWIPLRQDRNIICVGMHDAVHNLLLRNFEDWQPTTVVLGFGGDFDQPADPEATPPTNQGARIAPAFSDTYVRKPLFRAPIVEVKPSELTSERRAHYIALVRPNDANTDPSDPDRPYIDEFGLESNNGVLLAHYVNVEDPDTQLAEKNAKSDLEWLVVDWEVEFVGVQPS